jgi:hypothetical protein
MKQEMINKIDKFGFVKWWCLYFFWQFFSIDLAIDFFFPDFWFGRTE